MDDSLGYQTVAVLNTSLFSGAAKALSVFGYNVTSRIVYYYAQADDG